MSTKSITKIFEFEAAHHLPNYNGACRNLHGHSYRLEITVAGEIDDETGMIMDFSILKNIVNNNIISQWDHQNLNDFFILPTAENMGEWIVEVLSGLFPHLNVNLKKVRLWETSNSHYDWEA